MPDRRNFLAKATGGRGNPSDCGHRRRARGGRGPQSRWAAAHRQCAEGRQGFSSTMPNAAPNASSWLPSAWNEGRASPRRANSWHGRSSGTCCAHREARV